MLGPVRTPSATAHQPTDILLLPRLLEGRLFRWIHLGTWAAVALAIGTGVAQLVVDGWSGPLLRTVGLAAILVALLLASGVVARASVTVREGTMTFGTPFRRELRAPLAAVTHVLRVDLRSRGGRLLYRHVYALTTEAGSTLSLLAERAYRADSLAAVLALLPGPEPAPDAVSLRGLARTHKLIAPISLQDFALIGLTYVLLLGGFAGVLAGTAIHR
jgi:hypothetical protein